ncbi:MAG: hypothetical protein RIB60_04300 [Phycisphaerales bacterium]
MLESLLDALAESLDESGVNEPGVSDNLDATAEDLLFSYGSKGVDPGLSSIEIAESLETARDAEALITTETLGLDPGLKSDLLQSLEWIQDDLEAMQP